MNRELSVQGRGSRRAPPGGPSSAGSLRPCSCKPGVGAPPAHPSPGSPLGGHTDRQGPGGRGRGREEEGPGPRSAPHAPPLAGATLGGALLSTRLALCWPAAWGWPPLPGCSSGQAADPPGRRPLPHSPGLRNHGGGRRPSEKMGHTGLTGRRAGVHVASGATALCTSSQKGAALRTQHSFPPSAGPVGPRRWMGEAPRLF